VGVGECRAFENVRCEAAVACGYPDVAACQRFERDHCLHGVPLEDISAIQLDACAQDVARAGRCAAERGPDTAVAGCGEVVLTQTSPHTACEVVQSPELATSCAFLAPQASAAAVPAAPAPMQPAADGGG
jgi:hypothetical protein